MTANRTSQAYWSSGRHGGGFPSFPSVALVSIGAAATEDAAAGSSYGTPMVTVLADRGTLRGASSAREEQHRLSGRTSATRDGVPNAIQGSEDT